MNFSWVFCCNFRKIFSCFANWLIWARGAVMNWDIESKFFNQPICCVVYIFNCAVAVGGCDANKLCALAIAKQRKQRKCIVNIAAFYSHRVIKIYNNAFFHACSFSVLVRLSLIIEQCKLIIASVLKCFFAYRIRGRATHERYCARK